MTGDGGVFGAGVGCRKGRSVRSFEPGESERWVESVAVGELVVKASTFGLAGSTTGLHPRTAVGKFPKRDSDLTGRGESLSHLNNIVPRLEK